MNPAEDPSSGKPNPFYQPAFGQVVRRQFIGLMAATFGWTLLPSASAQEKKGKGGGKGGKGGGDDSSKARGPVFQGEYVLPESLAEFSKVSLIFGRATDKAITASLLPASALEAFLEIGTAKGKYTRKTAVTPLPSGKATEIVIDGLSPNTEYFYRLNYRKPGAGNYTQRAEARFSTQKTPGTSFVFTLQGDSHPERAQASHPDLYAARSPPPLPTSPTSISASATTSRSNASARSTTPTARFLTSCSAPSSASSAPSARSS